jgi:uncharacterized protein (DUF305 family)
MRKPCRIGTVVCVVACLTSLAWLAACVNAEQPAPPGAGATTSYGSAVPGQAMSDRHDQNDVSFLEQAVPLRQQAVTLAAMAGAHGSQQTLRSLANQIASDLQPSVIAALDWLRQWSQPTPTGSPTPSPNPVPQTQLRQLATTRGAGFDRQWAGAMSLTLTDSVRVVSAEDVYGEYPPVKAMALQWSTELQDEQQKLSALTSSS